MSHTVLQTSFSHVLLHYACSAGFFRPNHLQKHACGTSPSQKTKHRQNMDPPNQPAPENNHPSHPRKACLPSIPCSLPPKSQTIDVIWSGMVGGDLEKIAQTIPKSMPAKHPLPTTAQKPKYRQNIAWPGQAPGKLTPNVYNYSMQQGIMYQIK